MFKLLTLGNPKTLKGEIQGYITFILHLAPAKLSGYQTCAGASPGCIAGCLNTAGRGGMFKKGESTNVIQQARIRKTKLFFENRSEFMSLLVRDINKAIGYAAKLGLIPVFRLNGTSDLPWEKIRTAAARNIFEQFSNVQFYDYTAIFGRNVTGIANYRLTFSAKENNESDCINALLDGQNVAMVFDKLPETYKGFRVINGDESDLRFRDPKGVIIGLKAKGRAKKDSTGFVRRVG